MSATMPPYRCPTRGAEHRKDGLSAHQRQAHQAAQGFKCSECGTEFATRTQMEEHVRLEH
jgi:transposase-like protein